MPKKQGLFRILHPGQAAGLFTFSFFDYDNYAVLSFGDKPKLTMPKKEGLSCQTGNPCCKSYNVLSVSLQPLNELDRFSNTEIQRCPSFLLLFQELSLI